jgi:RNA-binding protein
VLTGKQRRHLRALAHELRPVVQVGRGGVDEGLIAAVHQALTDHELIKVKIGEAASLDRHEAAAAIAAQTQSEVAQVLGYTVVLYRAHPDDPTIKLPRAKAVPGAAANDNSGDDGDDGDDADDADDADDDADEQ